MKTITNVLGIGGGQPLLTPLLDSAQWIDVPVINASYEEVKLRFEHNGGINDLNGDANQHKFENEDNDLEVSPQELSTTFMLPMTVFNRRTELVNTQLMNLANSFLEAHLLFGGLGTKLFQNSSIKGALYYAHDAGSYTNIEGLVRKAMYDLESTQKRIISTLPDTTLGTNLKTLTEGALLNPYGKLIQDCAESDGELPREFVINSGSMILTGERTPRIEVNLDLPKNTAQVTVAWFVAGVPTGLDVAMKGKV